MSTAGLLLDRLLLPALEIWLLLEESIDASLDMLTAERLERLLVERLLNKLAIELLDIFPLELLLRELADELDEWMPGLLAEVVAKLLDELVKLLLIEVLLIELLLKNAELAGRLCVDDPPEPFVSPVFPPPQAAKNKVIINIVMRFMPGTFQQTRLP